ncbi:hypothetical protein [Roseisolibacter sp. H3M3-2]|uniref:hypothetical protein n=1 Tax=Roseisolibacter sp. H3M3-2 TaxID=3031323 RepID=UPI0023DBA516|nr:hypothetical protein [Roseisolibacter sp. H3M3-2]MDF1504052.1 hypothetical protein [Roseisolibacter sp. H3M3-2]
MPRFLATRLALAVALVAAFALAVAPLALAAQPAVAAYKLSMADVKKYGATMQELGRVMKAAPALEEQFTSDMDDSVDETARRLGGVPQFRPAFAKTGMTPRQFATTQFVILGAGMAVGAPKGSKSPEQLVKEMGIDPANVAFMRAHGAEIQALFRALRADD